MARTGAAAVLSVLGIVLSGCSQKAEPADDSAAPVTLGTPREASDLPNRGTQPASPEGLRWVGMNDVVVAVPEGWGTVTEACVEPEGDTVAFLGTDYLTMDCAYYPTHGVSSLSIAAARTGVIPLGRRTDLVSRIDGLRVLHSGVVCERKGPCETTFLVRGSGAVFRVVARGHEGKSMVESIRDSVTRLPDGLSTVPFIEYGRSLEEAQEQLAAAGLSAQVPDVDFPYYVTGTVPPAGSVVEEGTEVELEIGDG